MQILKRMSVTSRHFFNATAQRISIKHLFIVIVSAGLIICLNDFVSKKLTESKKPLLYAPPDTIKYFLFGYKEIFSDILWIRLLQDFGYCEQNRGGNSFNKDGARKGPNRTPLCSLGWNYQMLNLILDITPNFYAAALQGPISLSTVTDDIDGASLLFDKVTKAYPNDWRINYQAAYHFSIEVEDYKKAAFYFEVAARNGAPDWLLFSSARLNTLAGRYDLAKSTLLDYLKMAGRNEKLRKRILLKIDEIEKARRGN